MTPTSTLSPTRPRRPRYAMSVLAVGWVTALAGFVLVTAPPSHAADEDDSSSTGFTVTVPPAGGVTATPTPSPTPTPAPTPTANRSPDAVTQRPTGSGGVSGQVDASDPAPVTPPADAPAPTEPEIRPAPSDGDPAALDAELYAPGSKVTVTAPGFTPGEQVQVVLYSDPILVGNFSADGAGDVSVAFTLPKELLAGRHTVQLTGWASDKILVAQFLVGGAPLASESSDLSVPRWAWPLGGALALAGLGYGGRRLLHVMRAPAAAAPGEVSLA